MDIYLYMYMYKTRLCFTYTTTFPASTGHILLVATTAAEEPVSHTIAVFSHVYTHHGVKPPLQGMIDLFLTPKK